MSAVYGFLVGVLLGAIGGFIWGAAVERENWIRS